MSYKPQAGSESQEPQSYRYLPCGFCCKSTLVETLSNYGARCFECFESYTREAGSRAERVSRSAIDRIGQGGDGGPREWAYRLRERHQGGDRLTRTQIDAYKAVLEQMEPIHEP